MRIRRTFTKAFKLSILRELESKSAAELCRENNIHPVMLSRWKKDFERDPSGAFSGRGNLWREEAKLVQYERLIGQLYAENAFLKKTSAELQKRNAEEKKGWSK